MEPARLAVWFLNRLDSMTDSYIRSDLISFALYHRVVHSPARGLLTPSHDNPMLDAPASALEPTEVGVGSC
jgi:hypothetical protein